MKNIDKKIKNKNIDAIAEARKSKKFKQYSEDAIPRIKFAVEVYNARNSMGLSQQVLAKQVNSTQKIISRVENGDMNIGMALFSRFIQKLNFNANALARIFNCAIPYYIIEFKTDIDETKDERSNIQGKREIELTAKTSE